MVRIIEGMKKVLFIGDIVGKPGRAFVMDRISSYREENSIDIVIANGENSAGGSGITPKICRELLEHGIDAITLGDHVWDQREFVSEINNLEKICRPANLPKNCPGKEYLVIENDGFRLGVLTLLGRQFVAMKSECPFLKADELLSKLKKETDAIFVEIHAEATSEKIAMGWYLDGRVAAVVGTHTHVPTADARILPRGTAYLTDAGMSGPYASVLGREVQPVITRFLDGMPRKFEVAHNDVRISGCLIEIDSEQGYSKKIELITICNED